MKFHHCVHTTLLISVPKSTDRRYCSRYHMRYIALFLYMAFITSCTIDFIGKDVQILAIENVSIHMTWESTTMYGVRMNLKFFLTAYLYTALPVSFSLVLHNKIDMQAMYQRWCDNALKSEEIFQSILLARMRCCCIIDWRIKHREWCVSLKAWNTLQASSFVQRRQCHLVFLCMLTFLSSYS